MTAARGSLEAALDGVLDGHTTRRGPRQDGPAARGGGPFVVRGETLADAARFGLAMALQLQAKT